jgi:glycerol uptake facilitator-like aquaporin
VPALRSWGPAALAVAASVGLAAIAFGPLTGASLNPARSIGPALASGHLHHLWIYLAGPLVGAPLGALAYQLVRGELPAGVLTHHPEAADGDRAVRLPA